MAHISYPRLSARTQQFTLGRPRSFSLSPDGARLVFVRSSGGTDRIGRLWTLDVATGDERALVDPASLLPGDSEDLSPQERARRERMRESAGGIVGYAADREVTKAVFALSGRVFVTDLLSGETRQLAVEGPAIDPRLDPSGRYVAYANHRSLRLIEIDGSNDHALVSPDGDGTVWGLADFIAAEELDRSRGFWWSPDGTQLIVERYDESSVNEWYVSNPTHPEQAPSKQRYPASGTPNADVTLWLVSLSGERQQIGWDRSQWEYVAAVHWSRRGKPLVQLFDRSQRHAVVLTVGSDGSTQGIREQSDEAWVDVMTGVPAWGPAGQLLTIEVIDDSYSLCADGQPLTPADLQVRGIVDVGDEDVLLVGHEHPTEQHIWRWTFEGVQSLSTSPGVYSAVRGGSTIVMVAATLDQLHVTANFDSPLGSGVVNSMAETPPMSPNVTLLPGGAGDLRVAVVMPTEWQPGERMLPVLMNPYGGPHGQHVLSTQGTFRESQWFADQGFAVVVVDGHGTPGNPSWERAVSRGLASTVLQDQVDGLHAAAHAFPDFDLAKVAIRGWSFGGYLAALAVLDRPDVFHAAVAGAPVTDWELYDTAYTERYLGLPDDNPEAYRAASLLHRAPSLSRPLQIIHGFADDNVFVANSLQLSQVLTQNGRPHQLLPLTGITHMASQEEVAENLLLLQVDFLRQALGVGVSP